MANQDPITGIYYNFEEGSDGWTDTTNYNWRMLAFFSALSYVDDLVETLPSSPVTGAKYAHGTSLSAYLGASWFTVPAKEGYSILNKATGRTIRFDGSEWVDNATAENTSYDDTVSELSADNVQDALDALKSISDNHTSNTSNPHSVTKTQVGLGNVDNTADMDKPVSTATQAALNGKSDIGHNHDTVYLGITAKAADSDKLDGIDSTGFALASHNHDTAYLGIGAKAVDSDKLDGYDSADYVRFAQVTGAFGNLNSPLLNLPLKKNLLTAQGQSVCTFTRASAATYVDRYGMLKSVAADIPRFTAEGLLVEGASTNLLTYSEQFDNGAWVKTNASIVGNTTGTTDPYGTNFAEKLIDTAANSAHYVRQDFAATAGATYTLSVFAKSGEISQISLDFAIASLWGGATPSAIFDLSTSGLISSQNISGYKVTQLANGWLKVSITAVATTSGTSRAEVLAAKSGSITYAGDGTSGLYIFGAQLETMPFATSYIPTTTASVTRTADICSFPIHDNMVKLQQSSGHTYVMDIKMLGVLSNTDQIALGGDTTASRHGLGFYGSGIYSNNKKGGASFSMLVGIDRTLSHRFAVVYTTNVSTRIYIDSVYKGALTTDSTGENTSVMYVGGGVGSNQLYGYISNLRIYDRALTAEEVRLA